MKVAGNKLSITRAEWERIGKDAGWDGLAKKAQASDVHVYEVGTASAANGSLTKEIGGKQVDIDWQYISYPDDAHMADEVEFEWPPDVQIDDATREQLEEQWTQEVFEAVDAASGRPGAIEAGTRRMFVEAKKKGKPVNPWAICTKSVGREDKEKYERCVMDVKAKHPVKKD